MQTKRRAFSELFLDEVTLQIHEAVKAGKRIDPPSETHGIDYAAAVEVRRRMANLLGRYSGMPTGFKIAFTSAATQKLLGLDGPEFGYLYADFELEYDKPVDTGKLCEPYAEPEIAFVMQANLRGPGVTLDNVLDATRCIRPAIEIVDSRIGMHRATNVDMVADNAQCGRIMLSPNSFGPREFDLTCSPVSINVDGEREDSTTGQVMGHPAAAVAWLANRFAETDGRDGEIDKGDIILSGSCTRYLPVRKGSVLDADFGPMGNFHINFV